MKRFSEFIADQIISYLDNYHIVSDRKDIVKAIDNLIPKYIIDAELYRTASKDEISAIEKRWKNISDDKKIKILESLGDLDRFFANLIYQKSISDPELRNRFPELFVSETEQDKETRKIRDIEESKELTTDKDLEADKREEETKEDEIGKSILEKSEKSLNEQKELPEIKTPSKADKENKRIKFLKLKETPFDMPLKANWEDRLKHEVDDYSIYRDYAVDDKIADEKQIADAVDNISLYEPEADYDTGDYVPSKMRNLKKMKNEKNL